MTQRTFNTVAGIIFTLAACTPKTPPETPTRDRIGSMELTSPAFSHGQPIPAKYTCDGEDVSPPLTIAGVPADAKSLALIVDDPDAPMGTWVHWIVYNISPSVQEIAEHAVPEGSLGGTTSWGQTGYGGPCPPSGTHRYFFKLYALDAALQSAAAPDKDSLERAMEGHLLAQAKLVGTYQRQR